MNRFQKSFTFFSALSLTVFNISAFAIKPRNPNHPRFVPGELIVKFKNNVSASSARKVLRAQNVSQIRFLNHSGIRRVKIGPSQTVESAIDSLKNKPEVELVQPNYIYHELRVPNDPKYSQSWAFRNTGQTIVQANGPNAPDSEGNPGVANNDLSVESAWDVTTDCSQVTVAVIDSGVNYLHEELASNMWDGGVNYPNHGYDFIDADQDPMDLSGHGTHVAAAIGAVGNNSKGTAGVCWTAKIMAIRVLDSMGMGTTSSIVEGINFSVTNGAKVINMSLGGGSYDSAMNNAITTAKNNGVLVVAAAGNDGENIDSGGTVSMYPCGFNQDNILCVAAINQDATLASYSNYGSVNVDVGAPGTNILSAWNGSNTTAATDSLASGWNKSSTTSTGWGYKQLNFGSWINCLVNPSNYNYSTAKYANNTDDRIWKSFDLSNVGDGLYLYFDLMHDLQSNYDYFTAHIKTSNEDPIVSGTMLESFTGSTSGYNFQSKYDITEFASNATSIGFRLFSNASGVDFGANLSNFSVQRLNLNSTTYNLNSGTSMATPLVAGVSAMLFNLNPNYSYKDVIEAINTSGKALTALSGKTVTGKMVNAQGSIDYIAKPTGVSASVAP